MDKSFLKDIHITIFGFEYILREVDVANIKIDSNFIRIDYFSYNCMKKQLNSYVQTLLVPCSRETKLLID